MEWNFYKLKRLMLMFVQKGMVLWPYWIRNTQWLVKKKATESYWRLQLEIEAWNSAFEKKLRLNDIYQVPFSSKNFNVFNNLHHHLIFPWFNCRALAFHERESLKRQVPGTLQYRQDTSNEKTLFPQYMLNPTASGLWQHISPHWSNCMFLSTSFDSKISKKDLDG